MPQGPRSHGTATFGHLPVAVPWRDGDPIGPDWRVVFAGYGEVRAVDDADGRVLRLAPAVADSPDRTHAALVVSVRSFGECATHVVRYRTTAQLRRGVPANPWEVGWFVWALADPEHFYYFIAKPNGWELGKRDPRYTGGQRFLATGPTPTPIGQWREVRVTQCRERLGVWLDGAPVTSVRDEERPYLTGSVGVYAEDATADWESITTTPCR